MLSILPIIAAGSAAALAIQAIRSNKDKEKRQYRALNDWFLEMKLERSENGSVNPNARSADGVPALMLAVEKERVGIVETLLKLGAAPNAMDNEGRTALHKTNDSYILQMLLNAGATPNAQDKDGKSALFYPQSKESLKALKNAGADFNLRDSKGRTALFHTSDILYARALIRMGCDPDIVDTSGNQAPIITTPEFINDELNNKLKNAIKCNVPERVEELLIQGANPNYNPPEVYSSFMLEVAIRNDSPIIAEYLLKSGATVWPDIWKTAIYNSSLSHIKQLFEYSTPNREVLNAVQYKNKRDITQLFAQQVSSFGAANDDQRRMLIHEGGKITALDAHGRTALFYVKEIDVIEPLIKAGIAPRHIDNEGKTPLFYLDTADPYNILLADKLIKSGVDPDVCDSDGQKAHIIQNYDKIKKQYALDRELDDAVDNNDLTRARKALEEGADPNCTHQWMKSWNMLMLAETESSPRMLKLLLHFGADPMRYNPDGDRTALSQAQINPKKDILDVYRKHGYKI